MSSYAKLNRRIVKTNKILDTIHTFRGHWRDGGITQVRI
jgi:hypothetical protein